ncbi:MFS transporter [Pandoraea oxalativorans]|uniref:MFS transporter n=1 Tax=Pandoraea oxalativorans TaxID=573737 RepID=A0A0E3U530_9BURK|nr:MFS transporter [Pandoraea oxalativorans]AKC68273.1 MFS transporter [Pandoraea oxalativorans]
MSSAQISNAPDASRAAPRPQPELSARLILLLATGTGLTVASLYYAQPMLGIMTDDIHAANTTVGWVPTLTQLGYALGILLLVPMGDIIDRRRIVLVKGAILTLALLLAAFAPGIGTLLVASLAIGLTATMAQDIVPAAATLAPESIRGRVVGTVMTGLLLGILLSRVVSGFVAQNFGWRAMYVVAAISVAAFGVVAWRSLPSFHPTTQMSYRQLIGSVASLWRRHPALRRAAFAQALLSVGFSAFWSTLAVMLHEAPFHLGAAAAGAFGLAGAAGALGAPIAGRIADKKGPQIVTRLGAGLVAVSFAAMLFAPLLSPHAQLWLIGLGAIGFDLGVQVALISHQTIVYGIEPAARSRLNAVLFVCVFIGMSLGSVLGSQALAHWGWTGVASLATLSALGALAVRMWPGTTSAH